MSTRPHVAIMLLLAFCVLALPRGHAYPRFKQEIPSIPIVEGQPWPGLGHLAREGGGDRNPFGEDFDAAGYKWTKDLCAKDSDGDGFTNGQELGDPTCTWQKGQPQTIASSHPGLANSVPAQATAGK